MNSPLERFVLCLGTAGADDLEPRKVYQVLPDDVAGARGYLRVVDESGEDYLYPERLFAPLDLPAEAVRALFGGAVPEPAP